jgi:hypothetical protein
MGVNLFATVPKDHPGANPPEYFSGVAVNVTWAILHGPFWLVLHSSLGLLLVAAAVSILVQAVRSRTRWRIVTASFGLFGVLGARFNGGSYLNYHEDFSSMLMAGGFAIAVASYSIALSMAGNAEAAALPAAERTSRGSESR